MALIPRFRPASLGESLLEGGREGGEMVVSATVMLKDEAHSVLSGSTGSLLEGLAALSLTPYSSA